MKRTGFLLGMVLLVLVLLFACWAEEAEPSSLPFNFKTRASAPKETVAPEESASIQGSSASAGQKAGGTNIMASPLRGAVGDLSRTSLSATSPTRGSSPRMAQSQNPQRIEGNFPGRLMERSAVSQILEEHFQRALGDERKTVKVREIQGIDRLMIPFGDFSWEVKAPARFTQGGHIPVSLILWAGRDKVREVRAQARLEVWGDVAVAKNPLRRHQIVEEKDVQLVKRDLTQQAADVVTDLGEVLGKRVNLSVNGQEVLRKSMVEVPPLVKKGDRVILVVDNPSFKITCMGEAKEEGRAGERIKVTNISSKREVYGRVLDGHTVAVDY